MIIVAGYKSTKVIHKNRVCCFPIIAVKLNVRREFFITSQKYNMSFNALVYQENQNFTPLGKNNAAASE
jgi:hypothetical protein